MKEIQDNIVDQENSTIDSVTTGISVITFITSLVFLLDFFIR